MSLSVIIKATYCLCFKFESSQMTNISDSLMGYEYPCETHLWKLIVITQFYIMHSQWIYLKDIVSDLFSLGITWTKRLSRYNCQIFYLFSLSFTFVATCVIEIQEN